MTLVIKGNRVDRHVWVSLSASMASGPLSLVSAQRLSLLIPRPGRGRCLKPSFSICSISCARWLMRGISPDSELPPCQAGAGHRLYALTVIGIDFGFTKVVGIPSLSLLAV